MIDHIDEIIISMLSKNAKQDIHQLLYELREHNINISLDEIECRIKTLEDDGIISCYTINVNSRKLKQRVIRTVLVTFRNSQHLSSRLEGLKKYLNDAPFVFYTGRTRGGYDWICVQSFPSDQIADEETDIFRNLFGDIIQTYEVYDFLPIKEPSLNALTYTLKEYKKFLDEWIPPFL